MHIKRKDLDILIESLLLEKDLDYINPLRFFVDKNPRLKEFKAEVFSQLQKVYEDNPTAEFFGFMSRDVSRVVKQIYNDPAYGFTDRDFLQNEVKKFHYISGIDNIDNFLANASSNSKNEISTVGYIESDASHTLPFGKFIAIQIEGYVTFAANTNLVSGKKPKKADLEKYKSSGVPKFVDNDPINLVVNMQLLYTLTNHINFVLDNTILDRSTFLTAKQRSSPIPIRKGHIATPWNEFILDNWQPTAITIDKARAARDPNLEDIYMRTVKKMSEKYNLPIVEL